MNTIELQSILNDLLAKWESEVVEFKEANDNFSTSDIGKYFSALSNEANLKRLGSAWLVFGVSNQSRLVVGTTYREDNGRLMSLKQQLAEGLSPSITVRDIHVLQTEQGRVLLFEIPAAPRGMPIGWQGHYYGRNGESLANLSLSKLDEIRSQGAAEDWSAAPCAGATIEDLDPAALTRAREVFIAKYQERIPAATIRSWDMVTFLDQAKLTLQGRITRGTLLLLGTPQSAHFLSPYVAKISWKLEGPEIAYEHFDPPFLLTTSQLFQRIRNLRLSFLPPGQLIPVDVSKYDQRIVLEALHNCIAHQDYSQCAKVIVVERVGELEFRSVGSFYDGTPEDYISNNRIPSRYRNPFLAEAMLQLRMMDTMGLGIREVMFRGQAKRYLPMPDYDTADQNQVVMRLAGRFIDENYSRALLIHQDLSLSDMCALDRVQKNQTIDAAAVQSLRKRELIEGRKNALHVSAAVADVTDQKAQYIRNRSQGDEHYRKLILDYLDKFNQASLRELKEMLEPLLPDVLGNKQKLIKIRNLLTWLREKELIRAEGSKKNAIWRSAKPDKNN